MQHNERIKKYYAELLKFILNFLVSNKKQKIGLRRCTSVCVRGINLLKRTEHPVKLCLLGLEERGTKA